MMLFGAQLAAPTSRHFVNDKKEWSRNAFDTDMVRSVIESIFVFACFMASANALLNFWRMPFATNTRLPAT